MEGEKINPTVQVDISIYVFQELFGKSDRMPSGV